MKTLSLLLALRLVTPQCDTCLEKTIRFCIENKLPIVIPVKTVDNYQYHLISNAKYLQKYCQKKDSTLKDNKKFESFLLDYYNNERFLPLDWNEYRLYSTNKDSDIELLAFKKGVNDKRKYYKSNLEKDKKLKQLGIKVANPWENVNCNLWEFTAHDRLSKILIWELFNNGVIINFSDGATYLIDVCPP